jgi:bifunctional N-acetylglucosamine-1-phosphate-uridyltransferase/glucosamine-1-phosphate-acetyltransferase GlmU-like protein
MSAFSELLSQKTTEQSKGPTCAVTQALNTLPADSKADLLAALADPLVQSSTLFATLREMHAKGKLTVKVNGNAVRRHRNWRRQAGTGCACPL